jgi:hypothetical protein
MNAQYLRNRADYVFRKIGGMGRPAYLRVNSTTGGDSLIGRGGTTTSTDTLFSPQPFYDNVGNRLSMVLTTQGIKVQPTDYKFEFSANMVTQSQLEDASIQIVLKDDTGLTLEVLNIVHVNSHSFGAQEVGFTVIARSVKP